MPPKVAYYTCIEHYKLKNTFMVGTRCCPSSVCDCTEGMPKICATNLCTHASLVTTPVFRSGRTHIQTLLYIGPTKECSQAMVSNAWSTRVTPFKAHTYKTVCAACVQCPVQCPKFCDQNTRIHATCVQMTCMLPAHVPYVCCTYAAHVHNTQHGRVDMHNLQCVLQKCAGRVLCLYKSVRVQLKSMDSGFLYY